MPKPKQEEFDFDRRPGRPMIGAERRITITLTMAPHIADQLNEMANRQDLSRSRLVEEMAIQSLADNRHNSGGCP